MELDANSFHLPCAPPDQLAAKRELRITLTRPRPSLLKSQDSRKRRIVIILSKEWNNQTSRFSWPACILSIGRVSRVLWFTKYLWSQSNSNCDGVRSGETGERARPLLRQTGIIPPTSVSASRPSIHPSSHKEHLPTRPEEEDGGQDLVIPHCLCMWCIFKASASTPHKILPNILWVPPTGNSNGSQWPF